MSADLDTLLAKDAIRETLYRYCRGLDRMDKTMAYAVFHEDATADYIDIFQGSGRGFVDWVWEAHAALQRHSHQITNMLIEVDGDRAVSESYVTVALWSLPDAEGQQREIIARGRYLDNWERRDGNWAIVKRLHVVDLQSMNLLNAAPVSAESTRDGSDPSFGLFGD